MKRYVTTDPSETAAAISRKMKVNTDEYACRFTVSLSSSSQLVFQQRCLRIGIESTSATRVRSIYLGQMAYSLLDVSQVTDINPKCVKKSAKFGGRSVMQKIEQEWKKISAELW